MFNFIMSKYFPNFASKPPVMKCLLFLASLILASGCSNDSKIMEKQVKSVPVLKLSPFASKSQDTVYVLNFWKVSEEESVKQLSSFEKLRQEFRNKKVRVISVTLDKKEDLKSSIANVVKDNKIKSEIFMAEDAESKKWIEKISPFWSGNVPATFIIYKNQKDYYGYGLSYGELKGYVEQKLNPGSKK